MSSIKNESLQNDNDGSDEDANGDNAADGDDLDDDGDDDGDDDWDAHSAGSEELSLHDHASEALFRCRYRCCSGSSLGQKHFLLRH